MLDDATEARPRSAVGGDAGTGMVEEARQRDAERVRTWSRDELARAWRSRPEACRATFSHPSLVEACHRTRKGAQARLAVLRRLRAALAGEAGRGEPVETVTLPQTTVERERVMFEAGRRRASNESAAMAGRLRAVARAAAMLDESGHDDDEQRGAYAMGVTDALDALLAGDLDDPERSRRVLSYGPRTGKDGAG